MYGPTPKISWIEQRCRARGRTSGSQTCRSKASSPTATGRRCGTGVVAVTAVADGARTVPCPACGWRTSTTTCRRQRIAQTPIEPRDAARLLVDRGPGAPPSTATCATCPTCCGAGDLLVVNDTRVIPARLRAAAGDRRRRRGAAARSARRRAPHVGGAGAPGAQAARPARCCSPPTARRSSRSAPAPRPATRSPSTCSRRRPARALDAVRRGAAAALHHGAARRPRALPDRLRRPTRARRPRRPPACTSPPRCSTALGRARRRAWRRSSWSSGSTRSSRSTVDDPTTTGCTASATACPPRRWRPAGGADAGGRRRHHDGAGARVARPPPASSTGRTAPLHPPALRVAAGRRAAHQLPPAPHDAADDDRRLRRAALARPLRHGAGRRLPVPLLRRRHAAASGRRDDGAGHASTSTATDGAGARRHRPHGRAARYRTPCFMPVGTRGAVKYLSAADLRGPRRRDRARQHLPPDAAARAPTSSPTSAALGRLRRLGRPDAHRLRRLPGVLARARRSTTTASPSAPPTTARSHRLTPESAVGDAGAARRRHPDGARRLPAAAGAARGRSGWPSSARRRGPSGPGPPTDRDDQALFGIVQGGVDEALRAESARADGRARLRRLRHRRAVGGGDPGRDAAGAGRRARPTCPPTGPAT